MSSSVTGYPVAEAGALRSEPFHPHPRTLGPYQILTRTRTVEGQASGRSGVDEQALQSDPPSTRQPTGAVLSISAVSSYLTTDSRIEREQSVRFVQLLLSQRRQP